MSTKRVLDKAIKIMDEDGIKYSVAVKRKSDEKEVHLE